MERKHIIRIVLISALVGFVLVVFLRGRSDEPWWTREDIEARVAALVNKGDASSLMAAARLAAELEMDWSKAKPGVEAAGSRAVRYAREASQLAPNDAVVQWVWLSTCRRYAECDRTAAREAFDRAAPDNAASSMLELDDALKLGDTPTIDVALSNFAASKQLRFYWNSSIARVADALDADGVRPRDRLRYWSTRQHFFMAAIAESRVVPPVPPLKDLCQTTENPQRRANCDALLMLMSSSDSVLLQSYATSLMVRWAAPGSAEAEAAIARRRELVWLRERTNEEYLSTFNQLTQWSLGSQLALMRRYDSETEVMREALRMRGIPTEPPAGWKSS